MPNYGYHLARSEAAAVRRAYRALLPAIVRAPLRSQNSNSLEVFAYSGESALPEQVASIRSFIRHAGSPRRFTIVSDGTYSPRSIALLERIHPTVNVSQTAAWIPKGLPADVYPYLTSHPTGKQLALIMSFPTDRPVLYVDSDVLFFAGARDLIEQAATKNTAALYLADCQLAADERLFRASHEKANPVNTGVLLLFQKLDWSLGIERFLALDGPPNFFTNQTITHLTMHTNRARAFDERKYVLQLEDQFLYRDHHAGPELALRHYVNPVRHKFWMERRHSCRLFG